MTSACPTACADESPVAGPRPEPAVGGGMSGGDIVRTSSANRSARGPPPPPPAAWGLADPGAQLPSSASAEPQLNGPPLHTERPEVRGNPGI